MVNIFINYNKDIYIEKYTMKLLKLYALTNLFSYGRTSFVHNRKICKDCKFFIPNKNECVKFGEVNVINGKVTYESAINARMDETKCGKDAKYFEQNKIKFITVPYYFIQNYWYVFTVLGLGYLNYIITIALSPFYK
jgi:hypothetical protein